MGAEREGGFTLLEMLVALSVISIAALALIRLDAFAVRTAGDLDESTMAGIVAQNRAVELWTDPAPPIALLPTLDATGASNSASPEPPTTRYCASICSCDPKADAGRRR